MAKKEENTNPIAKEGKKKIEKTKRKIIATILPIIIPILIVLIIASSVFSIFSNITELVGNFIVGVFTATGNGIEITDEQIDALIATIEASGTDLDDLGLLR